MRHLFGQWTAIERRLISAAQVALFLDFDGTLSRLRPTPEQAHLDFGMRQPLLALAHHPKFRVWVISGRRLADVRDKVGIPGVRYLGLHGWEQGPQSVLADDTSQALAAVRKALKQRLREVPHSWLQDKQYALTVHYNGGSGVSTRAIVDEILARYPGMLIGEGKNVWEIMPCELGDKGSAIRRELAAMRPSTLPVFLGDDEVDEPAFAVLRNGITVRVGLDATTQARYRLASVSEVGHFLRKLRAQIRQSPG